MQLSKLEAKLVGEDLNSEKKHESICGRRRDRSN
jgi:hypothetical protein